jgi:hypothetical protein
VGLLWTITKQLERIARLLGEVRGDLAELNERQQLIRDSVHAISVDTGRSLKQPR